MNKNKMPFEKNRLRDLRRERDLTCKELAKFIEVSPQTINKWENEQIYPSMEKLKKLAKFFDVSTDYLLGNSDERNPYQIEKDFEIEAVNNSKKNELNNRLNKCLSDLNNKQLEILVIIAESFTKNI